MKPRSPRLPVLKARDLPSAENAVEFRKVLDESLPGHCSAWEKYIPVPDDEAWRQRRREWFQQAGHPLPKRKRQ